MRAIVIRFAGCMVALWAACQLFPQAAAEHGILSGSIMLTILYTLLRPLALLLALPFNLHIYGLLTPLVDALFVLWTSAWVGGLSFGYWQSAATALLISAAYYPYSFYTQKRIMSKI